MVKYFWSAERLQFGDQVEFRVTTRTYDQLVFATDISVAQRGKDIKFKVSVNWLVVEAGKLRPGSLLECFVQ